jgi:hypothetical protein
VPLPQTTHLQFLIIEELLRGKLAGRHLREALARAGEKKTGPAFYQLMARMEEAGWVRGWYEQKIVHGQIIKERWYEVLGAGVRAHEATREFYRDAALRGVKGGLAGG